MSESQKYGVYQNALSQIVNIFELGDMAGFTNPQIIEDIADKIFDQVKIKIEIVEE